MEFEIDKWDMEDIDDAPLNKKNKEDLRMTREYCDEHEFFYGDQSCEPIWDKKTGDLHIYEIIVHNNKRAKRKFVKERNEKNKHKPKRYKKKKK